jgi:hypothetical protein
MQVADGLEFLQVQKRWAWDEIRDAIEAPDANKLKKRHYSPGAINLALASSFQRQQWNKQCAYPGANHLLKDRIGIGLQFGAALSSPYELFASHIAFYLGDVIDVGIDILPMKELQAQMPSDVSCYEVELCSLKREGRGVLRLPLVLIGVAP